MFSKYLSRVYYQPVIGGSTRKRAVNQTETTAPRGLHVRGRDSGRYRHVSYSDIKKRKEAEEERRRV